MSKNPRIVLTEAVVHSAAALGVHIVQEIIQASLKQQPKMSLVQFVAVLDNYSADIKRTQTVKTTVKSSPSEVIHL